MNLVLLEALEGDLAVLRGARARHARETLGVSVGDELRVGLVRGPRGVGVVEEVRDDAVVLRCRLDGTPPVRPWLDVVLAVPRPKVLPRVLEALASWGVGRIDLVNAWRVDRSYFSSPKMAAEATRAALWTGCEQGSTTWLPDLEVHPLLVPFLEGVLAPRLMADARRRRILAHPAAPGVEQAPGLDTAVLAIGPEGGWIASELSSFATLGFQMASVAPAVLRVEVAVAAMIGQLTLWRRL